MPSIYETVCRPPTLQSAGFIRYDLRRVLGRLRTATQAVSAVAGLTALADLPHAIKAIGMLLS
jgi:hypothetical protein